MELCMLKSLTLDVVQICGLVAAYFVDLSDVKETAITCTVLIMLVHKVYLLNRDIKSDRRKKKDEEIDSLK